MSDSHTNSGVPNIDTERDVLGVMSGESVILHKGALARFLRFALVAGGVSLLTFSSAAAQTSAPNVPRPPQTIKLPQAVTFSFHEADWSDVLKWLAKLADKSLLMEKKPEGTFTYFDQRTYTQPEAMDVINRALIDKGFVTIIRDNFLIVANLKEGIPPHLVEKVRVEDLPTRAESELVKVLIQLNGQSADTVAKDFEPMLGPYGRIVALKGPNQVMIVDTVRAVRQIVDVIRQIDESDKRAEFRSFPVKNVSVLEVERVVRDLLGVQQRVRQENTPQTNSSSRGGDFRDRMRGMFGGSGGGFPGMPGGSGDSGSSRGGSEGSNTQTKGAAVSVDLRTNTLFVTAPPDKLALVADVVSTLDVPENATAPEGVDTQLRIEVYTVEPGTADGLSKVLDNVFKQSPDTRVSPHPDGRALIVAGTAREHEQIKRVLSQIQSETVKFEAISLRSLDAGSTADLLKALLRIKPESNQQQQSSNRWPFFGGGMSSQQQQNQPPSGQLAIEADIDRNRLLVRGTELQISQVRDILAQLGESGLAGTNRGGKNGSFRVIPLGDRDPAETAETLQRLWQRMDTKTPLKIEVLGAPGSGTPGPAAKPTSIPQDRPQPRQLPGSIAPMSYVAPADEGKNETSEPVVISNALGAITESGPIDSQTVRFAADEQPAAPNNLPNASVNTPPADPNAPATTATPPVTIVVGPDNIAIHSDDPEALELADRILGSFLRTQSSSSRGVAIFYLKAATAQDAAFLVEEALYGATSSTATSTPRAKLIPDSRTNSLLVIGPATEQRKVEQMLEIIDRTDPPESDLSMQPRMIKVHNSRAADIAVVVKDIFAKQLYIPSGQAGGGNNNARPVSTGNPYGQLTVGVDESTNSVVVSAPKQLADEVAQLVETLDTAAKDNGRVAQVVTLKNTRPEVVREALTNLFGVRTGEEVRKTQTGSTSNNNNNAAQQQYQGGYPQMNMGSGQGGSRNNNSNRSSNSSQRSNSSQNRNSGTRSTNRPR